MKDKDYNHLKSRIKKLINKWYRPAGFGWWRTDFVYSRERQPDNSDCAASRVSTGLYGWGIHRYPDMALYQEIIWLKQFYKGKWIVENVVSYYDPLISPSMVLDRHYLWANFYIPHIKTNRHYSVTEATKEVSGKHLDIQLPEGTKDQRKLLRNAVDPKLGLHILEAAKKEEKQKALL